VQLSVDSAPDTPVDIVDEGNEANLPSSTAAPCDILTSSHIDWSSYYTDEELMTLKLKLIINLQNYPSQKDISHIELAVCDNAVVDDEWSTRIREEVIKKGQLFESLNSVKLFFQDYAVRHHRSYYGAKPNKDVWYNIRCQISSCSWRCVATSYENEIHQWRLSRVKQPHTCGTSEV
jgi:hypothetical protein